MIRISRLAILLVGAASLGDAQTLTSTGQGDRHPGYIVATPQGQGVAPAMSLIDPSTGLAIGTSANPLYTTGGGGGGGGSVPTGSAGNPNANVVTVQGITNGTPQATNLNQVGGSAIALGATTQANALPVALSTDGPVGQRTDTAATTTDGTSTSLIAQAKQTNVLLKAPLATTAASGAYVDGWDVTRGTKADAAQTDPTQAASEMAVLKGLLNRFIAVLATSGCQFNTTIPTLTSGTSSNPLQCDSRNGLYTVIKSAGGGNFAPVDATGLFVHTPASTPAVTSGTISASGGTAAVTFVSTSDMEVINPSTGTLWASWSGTPAVNGAGSFPILANGAYRPPNRPAGTLTLLSTAASQTYTVNKF